MSRYDAPNWVKDVIFEAQQLATMTAGLVSALLIGYGIWSLWP